MNFPTVAYYNGRPIDSLSHGELIKVINELALTVQNGRKLEAELSNELVAAWKAMGPRGTGR